MSKPSTISIRAGIGSLLCTTQSTTACIHHNIHRTPWNLERKNRNKNIKHIAPRQCSWHFISLGQLLSSHRLLHSCQAARTCAICRSCLLGLAGRDGSNKSLAKAAPKPTKSWAYGRAHAAECHVPGSIIKKQLLPNTLRIAGSNTHCFEHPPLPTGATLSTHSSANQVATGPPMTTAWAVGSSIVTPLNHDMEALQKTQCFTSQDLGTAVYLWLLNDVAPKKEDRESQVWVKAIEPQEQIWRPGGPPNP